MAKKWTADKALVDSVAASLMELLPLFPKRMVRVDELVREHGMPFSHVQIMVMLLDGDLSVGELSGRLSIAKPNITPLVDNLRNHGWVERIRDERDRRIVNIHLTEAGRSKAAEMQADIARQTMQWNGEFSRSEIKELNQALATVIRIARGIRSEDE
ncbi:MAG: winged helix-turn-helix transcriptional regulator [Clostridia bacterium]|nr:winged helix-turn-helix transcriptional regulator [Clostridia bacterium]